jgi:hypothetical protein
MELEKFLSNQKALWSLRVFAIGLAAFPILRLILFLATTGANNTSNDDIYIAPMINQVLSGTYAWSHFFRDSFFNGHFMPLPILIHLSVAYFADWNVYFSIFIGLGLAVMKLLLLFDSLTYLLKTQSRWLLLPLLSALIFSCSQISTFENDFNTLQIGLSQFGLILGIWGLVRFSQSGKGIFLMVAGGLIASGTSGSGPLASAVFLVGLVLLGDRRLSHYLIWLGLVLLSAWPSLYFMFLNPSHTPPSTIAKYFNSFFITQAIGWPFAQNFNFHTAYVRGIWGGLLCFLGLCILLARKEKSEGIRGRPRFNADYLQLCIPGR